MKSQYNPAKIRIDGGIAQNDFICQQIANLTGVDIERPENCSESTSIGCAILSSYNCGILKYIEDAKKFYKSAKVFNPDSSCRDKMLQNYQRYLKIMKKF